MPPWTEVFDLIQEQGFWMEQIGYSFQFWNFVDDTNFFRYRFKVVISIHRYPLNLWHPVYFTEITGLFGKLIGIASFNLWGIDKSKLQLYLKTTSLNLISNQVVICQNEGYSLCNISIDSWQNFDDPPNEYPPPPPPPGFVVNDFQPPPQNYPPPPPHNPPHNNNNPPHQQQQHHHHGNQHNLYSLTSLNHSPENNHPALTPQPKEYPDSRPPIVYYPNKYGHQFHPRCLNTTHHCLTQPLATPQKHHKYSHLPCTNFWLHLVSRERKTQTMDNDQYADFINKFSRLLANPKPVLQLTVRNEDLSNTNWHTCMLIKVVTERAVEKQALTTSLIKSWKKYGFLSLQAYKSDYFIAQFKSVDDRDRVYHQSPWHFFQEPISLIKLEGPPNLPETPQLPVILWVQFHEIPPVALTYQGVVRMASLIGEPVPTHPEVDKLWSVFARLQVRIDAAKPLTDKLEITLPGNNTITVKLHYERVFKLCMYCGIMGHEIHNCAKRNESLSLIQSLPLQLHQPLFQKLQPQLGPWCYQEQYIGLKNSEKCSDEYTPEKPNNKNSTDHEHSHAPTYYHEPHNKKRTIDHINQQHQTDNQLTRLLYTETLPQTPTIDTFSETQGESSTKTRKKAKAVSHIAPPTPI